MNNEHMKLAKKVSVGGDFAEKGVDINTGDIVKINNAGDITIGEYGEQKIFKIETKNGEKNASFNQKSINILIDAFGDETENWVGKEVKVLLNKTVIGGKKVTASYFVTENYDLDEYGDVVETAGATLENAYNAEEYPEIK